MAEIVRGKPDRVTRRILEVLQKYEADHPLAQCSLYRQNSVSVRIRIIDPEFAGLGKPERSDLVWKYLDALPDNVQGDISTVILLTPDETSRSLSNFEFEDPTPSRL